MQFIIFYFLFFGRSDQFISPYSSLEDIENISEDILSFLGKNPIEQPEFEGVFIHPKTKDIYYLSFKICTVKFTSTPTICRWSSRDDLKNYFKAVSLGDGLIFMNITKNERIDDPDSYSHPSENKIDVKSYDNSLMLEYFLYINSQFQERKFILNFYPKDPEISRQKTYSRFNKNIKNMVRCKKKTNLEGNILEKINGLEKNKQIKMLQDHFRSDQYNENTFSLYLEVQFKNENGEGYYGLEEKDQLMNQKENSAVIIDPPVKNDFEKILENFNSYQLAKLYLQYLAEEKKDRLEQFDRYLNRDQNKKYEVMEYKKIIEANTDSNINKLLRINPEVTVPGENKKGTKDDIVVTSTHESGSETDPLEEQNSNEEEDEDESSIGDWLMPTLCVLLSLIIIYLLLVIIKNKNPDEKSGKKINKSNKKKHLEKIETREDDLGDSEI